MAMFLKSDPEERSDLQCRNFRNNLEKAPMDFKFFSQSKVQGEVCLELCRQMVVRDYKPYQVIAKEGDQAFSFFICLDGMATAWRRNKDSREPKEAPNPTNNAKRIAGRRGSIPAPGQAMADQLKRMEQAKTATYKPSLWCNIERTLDAALSKIKDAIDQAPTGPEDSLPLKALMNKMSHVQGCIFSWLSRGQDQMRNDLDDARTSEDMLEEGATCLEAMHDLYVHLDLTRREQLLIKFYLQLVTFRSDEVPKMDSPYDEEKADILIEELEKDECEHAFLLTDATRPDNPIVQVNQAFMDLTGYTRKEVLGKNPRLLQGKNTSRTTSTEIGNFLRDKQEDGSFILQNERKDKTTFWNRLYLAPMLEEVPGVEGEPESFRVLRWVGVITDVSSEIGNYQRKPMVQGIVNVCKFLLNQLRVTLEMMGPIFGSPEWGKNGDADVKRLRGDSFQTGALHPGDEYLGTLNSTQSFGNVCFKEAEEGGNKNPATILAGPEGCQLAVLNRTMWMAAHALEPVRFLRAMDSFKNVDPTRLQKLAVFMVDKPISLRQVVARAGQPSTCIYLVKQGMVSVQVAVDHRGNPLPVKQHQNQQSPTRGGQGGGGEEGLEGEEEEIPPREEEVPAEGGPLISFKAKRKKILKKEVALMGPLDAYDDSVLLENGEMIYPADLIAVTEDVVVYALQRKHLARVMGAEFTVHHKAVVRDRHQQRQEAVGKISKSTQEINRLMEAPVNAEDLGDWLGWDERAQRMFSRLPPKTPPRPEPIISPTPHQDRSESPLRSPRFASPVGGSPVVDAKGFLPDIHDTKRRHFEEHIVKVEDKDIMADRSQAGRGMGLGRVSGVEGLCQSERSRMEKMWEDEDVIQSRLKHRLASGAKPPMGSAQSLIKASSPKASPGKTLGRSKSSFSTYPALEARQKTLDNFCWNLQGGAKQVVKFESPSRSLSVKERRAFQRNLISKGPSLMSSAARARGVANRYS